MKRILITAAIVVAITATPALAHEATWYGQKGSVGACGVRLGTRHHRHYLAGHLPCGTRVTIRRRGRVAHGKVLDTGPFPAGDLDLSKVLFRKLAPLGAGRIRVHYTTSRPR